MWALLRLWHVEALDTVIGHPEGVTFTRTSYVSGPARWRELPQPQLLARIEQLLNAHYRHRAATLAGSGDPAQMVWFVFDFEWVEQGDHPGDPDAIAQPWVRASAGAHPALVERAYEELDAVRSAPRNGIAAEGWSDAFTVVRIDEDDTWHLVRADRAELFASRYS